MPRPTTPPSPFPLYLLPSIPFPFRRRRSSALSESTTSTASPSSSPPTQPTSYIARSPTSHLRCNKCLTDLVPMSSIVSKCFTGRHGRAYLVAPPPPSDALSGLPIGDLPNTSTHKPVPRDLVTGAHTVSDISCRNCNSTLGWKYVGAAEESQKYKIGKFILETSRVVKSVGWDGGQDGETGERQEVFRGDEEDIEFDSQDEDECEDLFSGIWSPKLARARRKNRIFARDEEE